MSKKTKKAISMLLVVALIAVIAIGGMLAYLTSEDSDVNVMTMGNVSIEQIEQEWKDGTLVEFEQGKPLYPYVGTLGWENTEFADGAYRQFTMSNVVDKYVSVKNTGKSPAYVRTVFAFEMGDYATIEEFRNKIVGFSRNAEDGDEFNFEGTWNWSTPFVSQINGENYMIWEAVHRDAVTANESTIPSLLQVYMNAACDNEEVAKVDGNGNGTYDIFALSQAVQTEGFATAKAGLDEAFGVPAENVQKWFGGMKIPEVGKVSVTPENIDDVDFTKEGQTFSLLGEFESLTISELGEGSTIDFKDATVDELIVEDDATVTGTATIEQIKVARNSANPIVLTLKDADLDITGEISVKNTDGKSILNIENSKLYAGTIYVGEHVNNHRSALAELNITNSFVSCEENGMGSTINVWGRSGVKATIYDSEIYTYSRGWHQSEDANDNSITFQGATSLDVDIQRSNMHLYGARSIINVRQYGSEATTINTNIDESLIWVVTKSSHSENTIPVWGFDENNINDSMLLFTKNVYQSTPAVFKSFVYGNPVVHGDYHVTTQCQWDAPIALADGQTVTFAKDANVSIYDGAGNVEFVKNGSAKVVVENGAVVKNIGGIN